jgi:hypothetical protein
MPKAEQDKREPGNKQHWDDNDGIIRLERPKSERGAEDQRSPLLAAESKPSLVFGRFSHALNPPPSYAELFRLQRCAKL